MTEYIERAAAMESILGLTIADPAVAQYADAIYYNLQRLPAADVVEVRHGHWIDLNAENSTGPLFRCSECSHLHNPNRNDLALERVELKPLYCDACGARMDKEDADEQL